MRLWSLGRKKPGLKEERGITRRGDYPDGVTRYAPMYWLHINR